MDSSDKPRSKIPIAVRIESGLEPVECDGIYSERGEGFALEFGTPSGKYVITHEEGKTELRSSGLLSYTLDFSDGGAAEVVAPFGGINFTLTPVKREVQKDESGVRLNLAYTLSGAGADTLRAVKVDARFLR